jgi:hypothetical protein
VITDVREPFLLQHFDTLAMAENQTQGWSHVQSHVTQHGITCSITCDSTRYHMHCSLSQKTVCNSRILSLESIPHSSQLGL